MRFGNDNNTDSEKQKSFATAENIELCSSSRKEKTQLTDRLSAINSRFGMRDQSNNQRKQAADALIKADDFDRQSDVLTVTEFEMDQRDHIRPAASYVEGTADKQTWGEIIG